MSSRASAAWSKPRKVGAIAIALAFENDTRYSISALRKDGNAMTGIAPISRQAMVKVANSTQFGS